MVAPANNSLQVVRSVQVFSSVLAVLCTVVALVPWYLLIQWHQSSERS